MNGKGKNVVLANGTRSTLFRPVLSRPKLVDGKLLSPKSFIKMNDKPACLVLFWERWGATGYGAAKTKIIHRWNIKSVLRRAGVR